MSSTTNIYLHTIMMEGLEYYLSESPTANDGSIIICEFFKGYLEEFRDLLGNVPTGQVHMLLADLSFSVEAELKYPCREETVGFLEEYLAFLRKSGYLGTRSAEGNETPCEFIEFEDGAYYRKTRYCLLLRMGGVVNEMLMKLVPQIILGDKKRLYDPESSFAKSNLAWHELVNLLRQSGRKFYDGFSDDLGDGLIVKFVQKNEELWYLSILENDVPVAKAYMQDEDGLTCRSTGDVDLAKNELDKLQLAINKITNTWPSF